MVRTAKWKEQGRGEDWGNPGSEVREFMAIGLVECSIVAEERHLWWRIIADVPWLAENILVTKCMFLYSAVSSPLDSSKCFTLHPRNGSKGDSNWGYLDWESGVTPLPHSTGEVMKHDLPLPLGRWGRRKRFLYSRSSPCSSQRPMMRCSRWQM